MAEVSANADGGLVADVRRSWQPTLVLDVTQAVGDHGVCDGDPTVVKNGTVLESEHIRTFIEQNRPTSSPSLVSRTPAVT
jgi:hypothetical protein